MSFDYDATTSTSLSTRKMLVIFGVIVFGIFIVLAFFVFPIKNLFRDVITTETKIVTKNDGICAIDTPDHPRGINNCPYNIGDTVIVKYKEGTTDILSHQLKK